MLVRVLNVLLVLHVQFRKEGGNGFCRSSSTSLASKLEADLKIVPTPQPILKQTVLASSFTAKSVFVHHSTAVTLRG
jgi:hypothetical protein